MDNSDGKQARRTGSSSPVGMLFDHFCDAQIAVMNCFTIERMLQAGNSKHAMHFILCTTCPFYYVLLEQYYTGEMNFPTFNAVDDGIWIYCGIAILTGLCGSEELWKSEYTVFENKVRLSHLLVGLLNVLMPIFAAIAFRNIYRNIDSEHTKKIWDKNYFIAQASYWVISWMTFNFAMVYSVSKIYETHNRAMQLGHGL